MRILFKLIPAIAMIVFIATATVFASSTKVQINQAGATPTVAPSKTPTSAPQVQPTAAPTEGASNGFVLSKPFTQDDLVVLTGNIQRPNGLAWFNNNFYTSCSGDWTVYEVDTETGSTSQYIYGVKNAHSLYVTASDDERPTLWIPDFQSNTLTRILRGNSEIIASNLKGPWGIAPIDNGMFLVTNLLGNNVVSINENGETKELIQNLKSPAGIATDESYLYVANTGSARRAIEWYDLGEITNLDTPLDSSDRSLNVSLVTGLQNVTNVVVAADGYLYFSYSLGTRGVVGRVDPNICREQGGCSNDEVEIVLYSELAAPLAGLTISTDMRLFVHSIFSPDIYWLQLDSNADPASD